MSRRKRLTVVKGKRKGKKPDSCNEAADSATSGPVVQPDGNDGHVGGDSEERVSVEAACFVPETSCSSTQNSLHSVMSDHDYVSDSSTRMSWDQETNSSTDTFWSSEICFSDVDEKPLGELYAEAKQKVDAFLPRRWLSTIDGDIFRIVLLSAQNNVSVQRSIEFFPNGDCKLFVHCSELPPDCVLTDVSPAVPLDCSESINYFVDRVVSIVNNLRKFEICSGYDEDDLRPAWSSCPFGEIDKNPYRECRFVETFRSVTCKRLVSSKTWRCSECMKLSKPLQRRMATAMKEKPDPKTNNRFLTEEQKIQKLEDLQKQNENNRKKISRLYSKMQELIEKQGVLVEQTMSDAFTGILQDADVTPAQSIFLQQQVKASQLKNSSSMKWHPTMIRFALAIHLTSPAAYELIRDTGMVKLPSSRTLYDYSHANEVKEGIDSVVIEKVAEKVEKLINETDPKDPKKKLTYKKYHVLMGDEMYISQNLVFDKFKGKLIGFTSLDDVEQEIKNFDSLLDNSDKEPEETAATKIMVYMIKGVSSGIKEVVATFATNKLSSTQMKVWTWKVIGALERSGVAIIAFVCDGSASNRAFIRSHKPATPNPYGIVFDTINKCARHRNLYFISDVPHLIKTVRNCLLNSKWDKLKSRRRMMKRGKRISWDFILRLYNESKGKTLRKSYKLNAMNINPDSYGRMKVNHAVAIISKTVVMDIRSRSWSNEASETANFLDIFDDWFDCLNGAHTSLAKKKKKPNLAPYTCVDDSRFNFLDHFLKYLDEWQAEAENANSSICTNVDPDATGSGLDEDCDLSEIEGEDAPEETTHHSRRQLSQQTLEGLRMTTLAFKPMVQFLLKEGTKFINARVFTQDPLEQHFSKIRAGHGGSNNPNLQQCLKKMRAIHIFGELGIRKRKGNSGEDGGSVQVTTEPLPKRKCSRVPKFIEV